MRDIERRINNNRPIANLGMVRYHAGSSSHVVSNPDLAIIYDLAIAPLVLSFSRPLLNPLITRYGNRVSFTRLAGISRRFGSHEGERRRTPGVRWAAG